jgi:hypothetical protein
MIADKSRPHTKGRHERLFILSIIPQVSIPWRTDKTIRLVLDNLETTRNLHTRVKAARYRLDC